MAAIVRVEGLRKTYRLGDVEVHALRGVDLEIERGSFVAVIGASGSGKSTFMNLLGLLDHPTAGRYVLDGEDVSELDRDERALVRNHKLGFVFQSFNLLARTNALENVQLPLLYGDRSLAPGEAEEHAQALLAAVGLGDRAHHLPSQLSGGQQQRVAIARALVNEPQLLLADEPTGNLDTRTSMEIMEILQRLNGERGLTVVLVTHEADIAEYAGRVVAFRDGRVMRDEPVARRRDAAEERRRLPAEEVPA
jgi:putative ABC transport system ATP-binding protein